MHIDRSSQVGLFLQIIAKTGKIPWDTLQLPAGRTMKACQVMLDKEKSKLKKTLATEDRAEEDEQSGEGNGDDNEKNRSQTPRSKSPKKTTKV